MCEKNNDVATEETVMCDLCHGEFSPDDLTETNDGMICPTCLDEYYTNCEDCGALIHVDDLCRVYDEQGNEVWVCSSCLENNYTQCADCEEYHPTRTMTDVGNSIYHWVCGCCRDNYIQCAYCGNWVHIDNARYDERRDRTYCEDCYDATHSGIILEYHDGHPNGLEFFGDDTNRYYGIELEVESKGNYNTEEIAETFLDTVGTDYWHAEEDGSLTNGVEFISQPMTLKWLMEHQKHAIEQAMNSIRVDGACSHDTNHCGLHFHVSRDALSGQDILNLVILCNNFKDIVFKLSRRTEGNFRQWAHAYDEQDLDNTDFKDNIKAYGRASDRYTMVNLTNRDTIEFRFFRGTLRYSSFIAALYFIDYLIFVAKYYKTENELYTLTAQDFITGAMDYNDTLKSYMIERGF